MDIFHIAYGVADAVYKDTSGLVDITVDDLIFGKTTLKIFFNLKHFNQ